MWLEKLEKAHNQASDTTFVWFPFTWLRPLVTEEISTPRRIFMALAFGVYYGTFFSLKDYFFNNRAFFESIWTNTIGAIALFFVWFSIVTTPLWNRRAKRASKKM